VLRAELESLPEFAAPGAERAGNERACAAVSWRDVYDQHFGDIYRLICRCGVAAAEVDDLAQTVFLRAFQRSDGLRDPSAPDYNLGSWLYGIALRVVSEHRRWAKVRRLKAWLLESTMGAERQPPATPEDASAARETTRKVGAVLARMSSKLSEVLVLRDIDERGLQETAKILGIPENTVRSRLRLAREKFEALYLEQEERGST
jgi:RNA polymerase sigma-70 factor (ECF subfamily)